MDGSKNATTEEAQGNSHDDTDKGLLASYEKSLESGTNSSDSDSDFEYTCEICDKTFSGPKPLRQHERGAKHMKQKRKKETEKEMLKRLEDHSEDEDLDRPIFAVCKTCDKQFVGPESFNQHLIGRNHKKRVAASKLLDQLRDDDGHISLEKLKQREKERKKMTKKTLIIGNRTFGHDEPHKSGSKSELLDQLEEGNKQVQQEAENSMEQEACFSVVGHTESYNSEDSSDDERFAENEEFQCTDCQKAFSGVNPWYQHLTSKTHKKTLKQKRLLEKLVNDEATPPPGGLKDKSFLKEDGDVLVCHLCHTSFTGPESASTHLKSKGHAKKLEKQEYKKKLKERKREAEGKDKTHLETSSATEDQPFTEVEGKEDIENQDLKIVAEINEYLSQESAEITKENESDAHKISSTGTSENKTKDAIKSDSK